MTRLAPFSSAVLPEEDGITEESALPDQFPASFRVINDLNAPDYLPSLDLIEAELNPEQLQKVIHHLWLAGRPVPPRPLHYQMLLGREIQVSERIDLHLVWGGGQMFLKPLPSFLLNRHFWDRILLCNCASATASSKDTVFSASCVPSCTHRRLRQCGRGFILSYIALVARESDFSIAVEKKLIPSGVTWPRWRRFVREFLRDKEGRELSQEQVYADVADRFIYGELRLNRLRLIDKVINGALSSVFMSNYASYGSFYRENVASIVAATAWILLILSAMQVGLGTTKLADSEAFQAASWGFAVFSFIAPIGAVGVMGAIFFVVFWFNFFRTRRGEVKRSRQLGRNWRNPEADMANSDKMVED